MFAHRGKVYRRKGPLGFGGGGAVTFLPEKNYAMPESVRFEMGMQSQTYTIFASNETAIIGKTV